MSPMPDSLGKLRVAASTSNLGPGFDCLGLCLSLYLEVEIESADPGGRHVLLERGGESQTWPEPEENLFFRAFDFATRELGQAAQGLRVRAHSEIPLARGFGGSGAATAAGLVLAHWIARRDIDAHQLAEWGLQLEGHPDNVTASLLGGCTLGVPTARGLKVIRVPVHSELGFAAAWPAEPLATGRARAALPQTVAFQDAIENPRRLALLLEGLVHADAELLALGSEDRLHERYRLPLLPGAAEALAAAREAGAWAASISGAGSGLVAIGPREARAAVAEAMRSVLERTAGPAQARPLDFVAQGLLSPE